MSYHTEKTLSSIRSLVDEWSIRKEGGKQSFFILKEIDKLLADTPIDDVVSSKDVADKKNEVTMLRLERDEMLIRRQHDRAKQKSELTDASALREANETIHNAQIYIKTLEAELSNSKSAIVMKNGVINDRVEHLERVYNQLHGFQDDVYEKNKTIDELNETIGDLRMAASDMLDTINECARGEAEDSRVLMRVVSQVKQWDTTPPAYRSSHLDMRQIATIVEDYLDAPESPVVTLKTPSMGTRVVPKNEETHIIDENKMKVVRMLVGSDMWVLHTDDEAVEDKQQKETIDELKDFIRELGDELADEKMTLAAYRSNPLSDQVADRDNRIEQLMVVNEALRVDMELAHNLSRDHIAGQDRFIEGLKTELDARNTVIKDFKAIEQKETDRLHTIIDEFKDSVLRSGIEKRKCETTIDELNNMYCDVCGKLEQIEKVTKDAISYVHIDEITKIIQEE